MTKKRKITTDEIIKLIEDTYKIKDIQFMKSGSEGEFKIIEMFEYVEGEE